MRERADERKPPQYKYDRFSALRALRVKHANTQNVPSTDVTMMEGLTSRETTIKGPICKPMKKANAAKIATLFRSSSFGVIINQKRDAKDATAGRKRFTAVNRKNTTPTAQDINPMAKVA